MKRQITILAVILSSLAGSAHAAVIFGFGGGGSFLRGGQTTNQGSISPFVTGEVSFTFANGKALLGFFGDMNFAAGSSGALNPIFYGAFFRVYFGGIKRVFFIDAGLDPIGLIVATIIRPPVAQPFFDFINWKAGFGFRFQAGKKMSIEPYFSFRNFAYPYLTGSYPVPRYFSPDFGLRLAFGL